MTLNTKAFQCQVKIAWQSQSKWSWKTRLKAIVLMTWLPALPALSAQFEEIQENPLIQPWQPELSPKLSSLRAAAMTSHQIGLDLHWGFLPLAAHWQSNLHWLRSQQGCRLPCHSDKYNMQCLPHTTHNNWFHGNELSDVAIQPLGITPAKTIHKKSNISYYHSISIGQKNREW